MPKSIHLICRRVPGGSLKGVDWIDRAERLCRSVSWDLSQDDAHEIIGGWVYMHESKGDLSQFGGVVEDIEETNTLNSHGRPEVVIVLRSRKEAKGQKWRGKSHGMAWCGGVVTKTLDHEQDGDVS